MIGIEVTLNDSEEIIKDNLSRIGIVNRVEKNLYPSCYLKESEGKYFICHFKDLLKEPNANETDLERRNTIVWLLNKWGLISIVNEKEFDGYSRQKKKVFILTKEQMKEEGWKIRHKYHYRTND